MGWFLFFFTHIIIPLFTNDPKIINISIFGLRVIGVLQFFDAIGLTLWFALTGAGNTLFPAVVESSLLWGIALPISYFLGVKAEAGFWAPWAAVSVQIGLFSLIVSWKVRKGEWKEIEV